MGCACCVFTLFGTVTFLALLGYLVPIADDYVVQYEWEDGSRGSHKWKAYSSELNNKLNAAVLAKKSMTKFAIGTAQYTVDFNHMTQTRKLTRKVRDIRRQVYKKNVGEQSTANDYVG